jgi:hypothetical protein
MKLNTRLYALVEGGEILWEVHGDAFIRDARRYFAADVKAHIEFWEKNANDDDMRNRVARMKRAKIIPVYITTKKPL